MSRVRAAGAEGGGGAIQGFQGRTHLSLMLASHFIHLMRWRLKQPGLISSDLHLSVINLSLAERMQNVGICLFITVFMTNGWTTKKEQQMIKNDQK